MNKLDNDRLKNSVKLRQIAYWINSANHDLDVAETLFQSGKYDWCLISIRYPDEKLKFYKMCTREFTEEHFHRIKEIYKCLLQKIKP